MDNGLRKRPIYAPLFDMTVTQHLLVVMDWFDAMEKFDMEMALPDVLTTKRFKHLTASILRKIRVKDYPKVSLYIGVYDSDVDAWAKTYAWFFM